MKLKKNESFKEKSIKLQIIYRFDIFKQKLPHSLLFLSNQSSEELILIYFSSKHISKTCLILLINH